MRLFLFIALLLSLNGKALAQTAGQAGAAGVVQELAAATFAERFPAEAAHIEVRVLRTSDGIPATESLDITLPSDGALPRGRVQVDVTGAGMQKVGWALLFIARFDSVAVSHTRFTKDAPVDPAEISIAWMETTTFHGDPLLSREYEALLAAGDLWASRYIREGQTLRAGDLRPAFAADTGDQVLMDYTRGAVSLRLSCKAREPGAVGDAIRLYAPDTDVTYRARLTAPGQAEWIETL